MWAMSCDIVPVWLLIFKMSKCINQFDQKKKLYFFFLFVNICQFLANAGDLPKITV